MEILASSDIQVTYSTAGPNLHYHHLNSPIRDFTGEEIRVLRVPDIGTLVSVTLQLTVDSGSTTFTLLLPRVAIGFGPLAVTVLPPVHC